MNVSIGVRPLQRFPDGFVLYYTRPYTHPGRSVKSQDHDTASFEMPHVELIQHGLVETLANTIGLRASDLSFGMVDFVELQEQLVRVVIQAATKLGSPIRQYPQYRDIVFLKERQHTVIERIGSGDGDLGRIQLGKGHRRIGIDHRLLIDPADTFQIPDIKGILADQITRMLVSISSG